MFGHACLKASRQHMGEGRWVVLEHSLSSCYKRHLCSYIEGALMAITMNRSSCSAVALSRVSGSFVSALSRIRTADRVG